MNSAIETRLPGVFFTTEVPAPSEVLPRMDIAAFVGFSSCGPVNLPVAVESIVEFRNVFGEDLPLTWDPAVRETSYAFLGPAVDAFFRNGGRRCWVVRVARNPQTHRFVVPGLVAPDAAPAIVRARCPGAWADKLSVGSQLTARGLNLISLTADEVSGRFTAEVEVSSVEIGAGDLLRFSFLPDVLYVVPVAEAASLGGTRRSLTLDEGWWLRSTSTPADIADLLAVSEDSVDFIEPPGDIVSASPPDGVSPDTAEVLTFELLVWNEKQLVTRLGGLGFDPRHERYWGSLPTDDELYERGDDPRRRRVRGALERAVTDPRFPLAGLDDATGDFVAVGMSTRPDPERASTPIDAIDIETKLAREGLVDFDERLFLDPDLAPVGYRALRSEAFDKRFVRDLALEGIHSLLFIDEVTMLAVPDAVQRGWAEQSLRLPDMLAAPVLAPIGPADARGVYTLKWSEVALPETPAESVERYIVEESENAAFEVARVRYSGADNQVGFAAPSDCSKLLYYRVRAADGDRRSPWSNTGQIVVPERDFDPCAAVPQAPELSLFSADDSPPCDAVDDGPLIGWSPAPFEPSDVFELEVARDTDFLTTRPVRPEGGYVSFDCGGIFVGSPIQDVADVAAFYRARAVRGGTVGPWSAALVISPTAPMIRSTNAPERYDAAALFSVQRSMLRMCVARRDIFAVLSTPSHYRTEDAIAHKGRLTPDLSDDSIFLVPEDALGEIRPLAFSEEEALSFGALLYPWVFLQMGREGDHSHRLFPPDGAVTGLMAASALARGAWVAPANRPIAGAVAVDPAQTRSDQEALYRMQVNAIVQRPAGFVLGGADTLSPDDRLRPINVRRLLQLLRRLVLREGIKLVFESNDDVLRRRIKRQFDALMSDLFERGAFAGSKPADAFHVVTDRSVNTQQSIDGGRLIVELLVAPSRPTEFLIVRLVQQGMEGLTVEGS